MVLEAQGGVGVVVVWPLPFGPLRTQNGHGYTSCTSLMSLMWFRCPMLFLLNFELITFKYEVTVVHKHDLTQYPIHFCNTKSDSNFPYPNIKVLLILSIKGVF